MHSILVLDIYMVLSFDASAPFSSTFNQLIVFWYCTRAKSLGILSEARGKGLLFRARVRDFTSQERMFLEEIIPYVLPLAILAP